MVLGCLVVFFCCSVKLVLSLICVICILWGVISILHGRLILDDFSANSASDQLRKQRSRWLEMLLPSSGCTHRPTVLSSRMLKCCTNRFGAFLGMVLASLHPSFLRCINLLIFRSVVGNLEVVVREIVVLQLCRNISWFFSLLTLLNRHALPSVLRRKR